MTSFQSSLIWQNSIIGNYSHQVALKTEKNISQDTLFYLEKNAYKFVISFRVWDKKLNNYMQVQMY